MPKIDIHFKVFEIVTNVVVKETNDESEAISYLDIKDLEGNRLYDYQWYFGKV